MCRQWSKEPGPLKKQGPERHERANRQGLRESEHTNLRYEECLQTQRKGESERKAVE